MNPTQLDIDAATIVLGWSARIREPGARWADDYWCISNGNPLISYYDWSPSTNALHDFYVLDHVRKTATNREMIRFSQKVWELAKERLVTVAEKEEMIMLVMLSGYQPGDYAKAALDLKKLVPWPEDWPKYQQSASGFCDMLIGPCICGAWHESGEFQLKDHKLYRLGIAVNEGKMVN